ncbi:MAG TPA: conjugal transfer protein TrbL family protein [Clostridium sp.]|uniref:conjugal transfer protein TrbL family protein n=1 Tax=Clostridium sp. TaxID=1506 RepID=UPI002F921DB3
MDIIFGWFKDMILGGAGKVLKYMSEASIDLFSNNIVDNVLKLMEYIGWVLLAVGILFAIVNMYISYLESKSIDAHLLILNIFKALIAILFLKAGSIRVFDLSITINDLVCKITTKPNYQQSLDNVGNIIDKAEFGILWVLIILITVIVSIIVCLIQILKRGGMYLAHIMVGYLYIFSIPSGNIDGFTGWCKQTVAIALTNILQTALLFIGLSLMASDITKIFLGIGVIMAASKVEEIAGKYGMSTGASRNIESAGRAFKNFGSTAGGHGTGGASPTPINVGKR